MRARIAPPLRADVSYARSVEIQDSIGRTSSRAPCVARGCSSAGPPVLGGNMRRRLLKVILNLSTLASTRIVTRTFQPPFVRQSMLLQGYGRMPLPIIWPLSLSSNSITALAELKFCAIQTLVAAYISAFV